MNSRRWQDYVVPTVVTIAGIALVAFAMLAAANVFFPALTEQSGLGFSTIGATVSNQATTLADLTGLSPATDLILFAAAYILVCVSLWLQGELRTYLSNRSHF